MSDVAGAAFGGLFSTGLGIMSSSIANTQQYNNNVRLAMMQRRWQLQDREHYENYNRPSAQIQRIREAGINPMAMTGQVSPGVSQEITAPEITPPNEPSYLGAVENGINTGIQLRAQDINEQGIKVQEATNVLRSRELDIMEKMNNQKIKESKANEALLYSMRDKTDQEKEVAMYTANYMRKEVENYETKLKAELDLKKADISYKDALTMTENKLRESRRRNIEASTRQMDQHVELMKKQGLLTDEQANVCKYQWGILMQEYNKNIPNLQAELLSGQIDAQTYANKVAELNARNAHKFMKYQLEVAKMDANHLGYFVRNVWSPLFGSLAMGYGAMQLGKTPAPIGYSQSQNYFYRSDGKLNRIDTYHEAIH